METNRPADNSSVKQQSLHWPHNLQRRHNPSSQLPMTTQRSAIKASSLDLHGKYSGSIRTFWILSDTGATSPHKRQLASH